MSESSRPGKAWVKALPVAVAATALLAMLALAPLAAAAPDPVASGSTTLTLNSALNKKLKKAGVKVTALKPTKLKGTKATFAVNGGELELTSGVGTIAQSGGLKVKWAKKSVSLRNVEVNTKAKSLNVKLGGKTVKLGKLTGISTARLGFGATVTTKTVKLTGAGAKALNQKLTPAPTKTKVKKNGKTVTKVVKTQPLFKANMVLGKTSSQVEPETVGVLPTGSMVYSGDPGLLGKLANVGVKIELIAPTTASGTTFTSPLSGGTISPLGTSGQVNSSGGLKLVQDLPQGPSTSITLGAIGVDLAAKTASVEVIGESNAESEGKKPLNVGNLGRSSIADLTITSTVPSPATRTVAIGATAAVQPVAAEVLEGFVKVFQGYYTVVATKEAEAKGVPAPEAAKLGAKLAEEKVANDHIKAGESLGSFSFTATGE